MWQIRLNGSQILIKPDIFRKHCSVSLFLTSKHCTVSKSMRVSIEPRNLRRCLLFLNFRLFWCYVKPAASLYFELLCFVPSGFRRRKCGCVACRQAGQRKEKKLLQSFTTQEIKHDRHRLLAPAIL